MLNTLTVALEPGEELTTVTTDCCPRLEKTCVRENCPAPKKCQKFFKRVRRDDGDKCCPIIECGKSLSPLFELLGETSPTCIECPIPIFIHIEHPDACIVWRNKTSSNGYGNLSGGALGFSVLYEPPMESSDPVLKEVTRRPLDELTLR